jgi:hypothetical protein
MSVGFIPKRPHPAKHGDPARLHIGSIRKWMSSPAM